MNVSYPQGNLSDSKQSEIYGASCGVFLLILIVVALRFYSRKVAKAELWWDDWLIAVALLLDAALLANTMLMLRSGLGRHSEGISLDVYHQFMKTYMAGDVLYACTLSLTNYSILAFYWRIFGQVASIHLPVYVLVGLVAGWLAGLFLLYVDTAWKC